MHVSNLDALEAFTTKDGSQVRELVGPAWTPAEGQSLAEAVVPQGAATAEHYHRETEELYFFLEGSGRMRVGDAERDVAAGDCVVIPPGERHKLRNTGDGPLRAAVLLCARLRPRGHGHHRVRRRAVLLAAGGAVLAPAPAPGPAGAALQVAEFRADCLFSHRKMDDPILRPGLPGAFHSHDFFGNRSTNARSTLRSLRRARTSCEPEGDRSAYWVPTLYDGGGRPVTATRAVAYYVASSRRPDRVRPYPLGLMMIAAEGEARGARTGPLVVEWGCFGAQTPRWPGIGRCPKGAKLELDLRFPDCWNGRDLDSADHRSHMAYSVAGACPATHPVAVPALRLELTYPTRGSPAMRLASGPGYTAHGDFINAWEPRELARRIRDCFAPAIKCDPYGLRE